MREAPGQLIEKLGRSVELDDALVKEYEKYGPLTDSSFVIVLLSRYGHAPSEDELSDGELSQICNDVLLSELKTYTLVPKALEHIDELKAASERNELLSKTL